MRREFQALLVTGWLAVPTMAMAQTVALRDGQAAAALQDGAVVRVVRITGNQAEQVVRGRLSSVSGDTVGLRVADAFSSHVVTVVLDQGRALQVRTGRKSQWLKGLAVGILVGGAAGGMIGAITYQPCVSQGEMFDCLMDFGQEFNIAAGASAGALLGGVLGTVIGASQGRETWAPVSRGPAPRVRVAPAAGGIAVGVTLAF